MSVDKGGILYGIDVQYPPASSGSLAQFRDDLLATKAAYLEFKAMQADNAAVSASNVAAAKREAQAHREAAKSVGVRELAEKGYAKEVLRSAVSREKAVIADERQFALDKKILTAKQLRRKAEQDVSEIVNRRNILMARAQAIQERGLQLDVKELVNLGLASRLKKQAKPPVDDLTKATDALAKAKARLADAHYLETLAQTKATQAQIRAQVTARSNQIRGVNQTKPNLPTKKDLDDATNSSNLLWNSLKRVLFIAVAFKTAGLFASTIREAITEAVRFNSQMKQAEVGIAALISSAADVRDEFGNAARDQNRFVIALGEARKQTRALQRDALLTNATFEELVEAFQQGVAPGLEAGLDLDQIRNFTRQISAAAQAIGLPQAQLAEEIRSILGGTITARQTRIATALGITNEDIRNAKETGNLADFLARKFKTFDLIAQNSGDIVDVLAKKVKTAISLILGTGGQGFVSRLQNLLQGVLNSLVTINKETNEITLNPRILRAVEILGTGLGYVADRAGELFDDLLNQDVEGFAQKVADGIKVATEVVIGFVQGLGDAVRILTTLAGIVLPDDAFSPQKIRSTVRELTKYTAVFLSLKTVADQFSGILKGVGPLLGPLGRFLGFLTRVALPAIAGAVTAIGAGLTGITVAIGAVKLPLIAVLGLVVAIGAAVYFVVRNFERLSAYAAQFALTVGDSLVSMGLLPQEMKYAIDGLSKAVDIQLNTTKTFGQTLKEDWESVTSFLRADAVKTGEDMAKNLQEGLNAPAAQENAAGGFVLGVSAALEAARKEIEDLRKRNRETLQSMALDFLTASDRFVAAKANFESATPNLNEDQGSVFFGNSSIISASTRFLKDRVDAEIKVLDLNKDLRKEAEAIAALRAKQVQLESIPLANERERLMMEEDLERVNAQISAHLDRQRELQNAKNQLLEENTRLARMELDLAARRAIEESKAEAVALRVRALRLFGREEEAKKAELDFQVLQDGNRFLVERQRLLDNIAELEAQRARFKDANDEQPTEIDAQIERQRELLDILTEQYEIRQRINQEEQRRQNLRASSDENDLLSQLNLALQEMEERLPNQFQRVQIVVESAVSHLTDFISNGIVDAFDPTKKVDLRERFGLFLQGIATDIIQMLARIAAVKLALGLAGVFGASEGGLVPSGFNKGGRVNPAKRSAAHRHIRGYAGGGGVHPFPRPAHISPKDTVPAWLQPKEYVQPVSAVRLFGEDLMDRLRMGLADPYAVRAAAGLNAAKRGRATSGAGAAPRGYTAGGSVTAASSVAASAPSGIVGAVVLADDTTAETIMSQGRSGVERLLNEWGYQKR